MDVPDVDLQQSTTRTPSRTLPLAYHTLSLQPLLRQPTFFCYPIYSTTSGHNNTRYQAVSRSTKARAPSHHER